MILNGPVHKTETWVVGTSVCKAERGRTLKDLS